MATKRIRDLITGTPAAGDFLAVDPASGSTYKVPVDYFTPARSELVDFNTTDWNTLTTPGVYIVSNSGGSGGANRPPATYPYGLLLVLKSASFAPGLTQIYIPHYSSDPGIYIRQSWEGTINGWGGWKTIGTYYGSNSNGAYTRFADGTQVAFYTYPGGTQTFTWTYPAAFSAAPVVQAATHKSGADTPIVTTLDAAPSATSVTLKRWYWAGSTFAAAWAEPVYLIAIGRWK